MPKLGDRLMRYVSEGDIWILAIRRRGEKLLFEGDNSPFELVPNTFLYWKADPFLFEYQGEHYLFAEMFNRLLGRGCLGVAKVIDGKCSAFKPCLKLPCHLSYPCVFEREGIIYLLPEMASSGTIRLYKSVSFPYQWEEVEQLCDIPGVDTTPLPVAISPKMQFVSTLHLGGDKRNDNLHLIGNHKEKPVCLMTNNPSSRPAGHFIEKDGKIIRPVQDCAEFYGRELLFNQVDDSNPDSWKEHTVLRVAVPSDSSVNAVSIHLSEESGVRFKGIHTYNLDSQYEVIDLQFNVGKTWQYLTRKLIKRMKRLF